MPTLARSYHLFLLAALSAVPLAAEAVTIGYQLFPLGGNLYRYEYTVTNEGSLGAGVAVRLFDIQFDPADYGENSLAIVTPAPLSAQWQEFIFPSIPSLGVNASYNAYAPSSGVAVGDSVTGFAVEFEWLGNPAGPGSQFFEIYDPLKLTVLETGMTSIPLPGTLYLFGLGLVALTTVRHRRHIVTTFPMASS